MKLPSWSKTSLIGMPLLCVVTMLNAATFWPIAFDFIDWLAGLIGKEPKYASFMVMPSIFYICWIVFALIIGLIAVKLSLSIVSILAAKSFNGNGDLNTPNTVTDDFSQSIKDTYTTGMMVTVVFIISFGMGLYQQSIRFDQIQLQNNLKNLKSDIKLHAAKLGLE